MSAVPADLVPVRLDPIPPSPQPRGPLARLQRLHIRDVAVFGAFMAIFAMALRPVVDNDVFWHLATGRYMWATGHIPHTDPFSWTAFGRAWIAHEWLTELWLYPLYTHGGYAALMLLFAAIITAAFALAYATARDLGASRPLGVATTVLAAVASSHTWGIRPQMISMLFMALMAWILTRGTMDPARRRMLWTLVPLMVLWANLHGGFIFGLALIGIFALGQSCGAVLDIMRQGKVASGGLWRILALAVAACVVNPNGLKGLIYPFSYLGNNASTRYIAEWVSPDFHQLQYQFFEALLLAMVVGIAFSPRRPWSLGAARSDADGAVAGRGAIEVLLILCFTHLALDSVRNINLFAVIVAPLIAVYVSAAWRELAATMRRAVPVRASSTRAVTRGVGRLNLVLAAVIAIAVLAVSAPGLTSAHNTAVQARRFPAEAVSYLLRHRPAGPMLNSYDWGGYLIWRLYPRMRVYVDGRPDMYGDRFVDAFISTWHAQPGWAATLNRQHVRLVLVEPSSGLGRALATARGWRLVYHDNIAVLYERIS